jgi:hypothetical protein
MGHAETVRPDFFRDHDCRGPDLLDELASGFLSCRHCRWKGLEDGAGSLGRDWRAMERYV